MKALMVALTVGSMKVIAVELMKIVIGFGLAAPRGKGAMVAIARIKIVVDRAVKAGMTVEPRTGADEYTAVEPLRTVIAVRGAVIRGVAVAVGTNRCSPYIHPDGHLSFRPTWNEKSSAQGSCRGEEKIAQRTSLHAKTPHV